MYSILIKNGNNTFVFVTDDESGAEFTGTLGETKAKYAALLDKYPRSKLKVVHNVIVTDELTIEDVTA